MIAYNTIGTNDAVFFYGFAKVLSEHGLEWTYQHSRYFIEPAQNIIITILKLIIVCAAFWIAWQHRHARGRAFVESLAYTWLVFFVFAPGVCPQYLIWLAPFILVLSPTFFTCLLVSSSAFLFAFYNITSGGLPWTVSLSVDDLRERWIPWSLLPWLTLVAGAIAFWWRNRAANEAAECRNGKPAQQTTLSLSTALE